MSRVAREINALIDILLLSKRSKSCEDHKGKIAAEITTD
jgi:hypothetical protein